MVNLLAVDNAFALFDLVVLGFEVAEHFLVEQDVGVMGRREQLVACIDLTLCT